MLTWQISRLQGATLYAGARSLCPLERRQSIRAPFASAKGMLLDVRADTVFPIRRGNRPMLLGAVILIALILTMGVARAAPSTVRNAVLIVLDDQNIWPTMDGRTGDPYAGALNTPNIDAIARRGHLFRTAYTVVGLCSPSRATFLTGQTPFETQVLANVSPWQSLVNPTSTLPAVMKAAGFKVGVYGKVFHDALTASFKSIVSDEYKRDQTNWGENYGNSFNAGPGPYTDSQHGDYINTSAAIDFVTKHRAEPFFIALGLFKPHSPWVVPKPWFDKYPLASITPPPSLADDLSDLPPYMQDQAYAGHLAFLDAQKAGALPKMVQAFSASISFADAMIGRLLQALTANQLNGNTAIVLVGDNGYHFGEKTVLYKWTPWEEALRVPLIIADPSHPGAKVVNTTVELPDIYPTILDLVNVPTPAWVTAKTLTPQLANNFTPSGRPAISSYLESITVRSGNFAYIRHPDASEELYNLANDPRELSNKASDPTYASKKAQLAKQVESYATKHSLFLSHRDGETIVGTSGRNVLSGGHKVTLVGLAGDDLYIVHNSDVVVTEAPGGGVDAIMTQKSYTLPANVENLIVPEHAAGITVHGNDLNNYISVSSVSVVVYDGGGLDTIVPGNGTRIVLQPNDNALDVITKTAKLDLSLFGTEQTCSFAGGVLTVNSEPVAKITAPFALNRDVANGCGLSTVASASKTPSLNSEQALSESVND